MGLSFQSNWSHVFSSAFLTNKKQLFSWAFTWGRPGAGDYPLAIIKRMISGYFHWKKMKIGQKEHLSFSIPCLLIGHFRVPPGLCFKTRVGAQPLIWKSFFILMQIKLIFTRKVVHLASFWKWGFWNSEVAYRIYLATWNLSGNPYNFFTKRKLSR